MTDPIVEQLVEALREWFDYEDFCAKNHTHVLPDVYLKEGQRRWFKFREDAHAALKAAESAKVTEPVRCKLCNHPPHTERCQEDAPNAQFRCSCAGECLHGKDALYCRDCAAIRAGGGETCLGRGAQEATNAWAAADGGEKLQVALSPLRTIQDPK